MQGTKRKGKEPVEEGRGKRTRFVDPSGNCRTLESPSAFFDLPFDEQKRLVNECGWNPQLIDDLCALAESRDEKGQGTVETLQFLKGICDNPEFWKARYFRFFRGVLPSADARESEAPVVEEGGLFGLAAASEVANWKETYRVAFDLAQATFAERHKKYVVDVLNGKKATSADFRHFIFVRSGIDVNVPIEGTGETILMTAATFLNVYTVRDLIRAGANVFAQDNEGNTMIHYLVDTRVRNIPDKPSVYRGLPKLLAPEDLKRLVNIANNYGQTPLMRAERTIHPRLETLLDWGADKTLRDNAGRTAEDLAVEEKNPEALAVLRREGFQPGRDRPATWSDRDQLAKNLVEALRANDVPGARTALTEFEALGTDPTDLPGYTDSIQKSIIDGREEMAILLLSKYRDRPPSVFLTFAVRKASMDVVKYLLKRRVRPFFKEVEEAIHLAKGPSSAIAVDMLSLLLEARAPVTNPDLLGPTVLMVVIGNRKDASDPVDTAMFQMLLHRGADINRAQNQRTALMWAAIYGRKELARLLLARPDLSLGGIDRGFKTAEKLAEDTGHREIARMIRAKKDERRRGDAPATREEQDEELKVSFIRAVKSGSVSFAREMANKLKNVGVDVTLIPGFSEAIERSMESGRDDMAIFLLGELPVIHRGYVKKAIDERANAVLRFIFSRGVEPTFEDVKQALAIGPGYTEYRGLETLRTLLDAEAPLDSPRSRARSALMLLIDKRRNRSNADDTAMFQLLLERGALINRKTDKGKTALMKAAVNGRVELARLLLAREDIVVDAKDRGGFSALDLARRPPESPAKKKIARMILERMGGERTGPLVITVTEDARDAAPLTPVEDDAPRSKDALDGDSLFF